MNPSPMNSKLPPITVRPLASRAIAPTVPPIIADAHAGSAAPLPLAER